MESAPGSRPSQERVREALFSSWRTRVEGARFLDLFAGSGCVGFEALSRGARSCHFVENRPGAIRVIERNAAALGIGRIAVGRLELPAAASRLPRAWPERFDLVFADPPYDFDDYETLLAAIEPLLEEDGEAAVEHSKRRPLHSDRLNVHRQRRHGESSLTFLRRGHDVTPASASTAQSVRGASSALSSPTTTPSAASSAARKKVSSSR